MFELPIWLEDYRLPDSLCENAYQTIDARLRSCLKTGIALADFHFGFSESLIAKKIESRHRGFFGSQISQPVDWALLFFDISQKAAARICAAAILPRLADVEVVAAICIGGQPADSLLLSLDLCGVEDIFTLNMDMSCSLLQELAKNETTSGCICLLHNGCLAKIYEQAQALRIPASNLIDKPRLYLAEPDLFESRLISFCQDEQPDQSPSGRYDCIYARPELEELPVSRLRLGPGCEGFWLFPGLGPEFYSQQNLAFGRFKPV